VCAWQALDLNVHLPLTTTTTTTTAGASSGLGLEVARLLAHRGATVVLACRSLESAAVAKSSITSSTENQVNVDAVQLDLADLKSIRKAAKTILAKYPQIHIVSASLILVLVIVGTCVCCRAALTISQRVFLHTCDMTAPLT
jgi:NAD(P)-dependent dehydrogenase (short-subunit alcohol dehydrogenase family)